MSTETSKPDPKQPKDPKVDQLLREGLAAIKLGDKASARAKLQEVVALDQYNEQGWYWLASVVETDEERRVCLGNVVVINPKNERAQTMLERLSGNLNAGLVPRGEVADNSASGLYFKDEAKRGLDRRVILIGVGILVLLVVVVALFALGGGRGSPPPEPTLAALGGTQAATTVAQAATNTQSPTQNAGPATQAGTESVDLNAPPPTLPPTWTPAPTGGAARSTPLPTPPPALAGRLLAIQGNFISSATNLPIVVMDPYGKNVHQVTQQNDIGDYAILMPDGQRMIYSRFISSTNAQTLRVSFSNGTRPTELSTMWGNEPPISNVRMPSVSRNGAVLVFSASNLLENDSTPDIYTIPTRLMPPAGTESEAGDSSGAPGEGTQPPTKAGGVPPTATSAGPTGTPAPVAKVQRVTPKDSGINTWPSVSPDGSKIVYVSDTKPLGTDGTDLYVIGAKGGTATNLTNDLTENTEAAPEWSPDGTRIAYQVMAKGSKNNAIVIIDAAGKNKVELIPATSDNIRPHWSPDGQFIAFSSNRGGSKYDVFIVNVQTKAIYEVTQGTVNTICTSWGPS